GGRIIDEYVGAVAGQLDQLGQLPQRRVFYIARAVVVRDGGDQQRRQPPLLGEDAAGVGVIHAQGFVLGRQQVGVAGDLCVDLAVPVAQDLVEHQHPDVLQQRRQERLFLLHHLQLAGDRPGGGGGVDAALPVDQVLEPGGLALL